MFLGIVVDIKRFAQGIWGKKLFAELKSGCPLIVDKCGDNCG